MGEIHVGSFLVRDIDIDYIEIIGQYNQKCIICIGDLESILSGLCGVQQPKEEN